MGVLGLWDILESVGHPVKVEGLEGKVLGVDANIWLYKFIRGFREKDNATSIESHKLGLFNRISKLLFYRIKPVFVFDGPAPVLKRRTLERRQNTRNKTLSKVQDAAMRALANQLKSQYPGADIDHLRITLPELRSNNLVAAEKLGEEDFNLFYLPPEAEKRKEKRDTDDDSYSDDELESAIQDSTKVDIESKDFGQLPPEIRYEILQDIKANRRRIRNVVLPDDAGSFSNLQLERLKARRGVQEKIEECEKEICANYTGEMADGKLIQAFRVQSDATSTIFYRNNTYDPKALDKLKPEKDETKVGLDADAAELNSDAKSGPHLVKITTQSPKKLVTTSKQRSDEDETMLYVPLIAEKFEENYITSTSESEEDEHDPTHVLIAPATNPPKGPEEIVNISETEPESESSDSEANDQSNVSVIPSEPNKTIDLCSTISLTSSSDSSILEADQSTTDTRVREARTGAAESQVSVDKPISSTDKRADNQVSRPADDSLPIARHSPIRPLTPTTTRTEPPKAPEAGQSVAQRETTPPAQQQSTSSSRPKSPTPEPLINEQSEPSAQGSRTTMPTRPLIIDGSQMGSQDEQAANAQRATNKVTGKIIEDAKELLRLFGIPYIDAAGEAEAQCAKLEELKLTMGTITDDSDIWLFGSQNVYRYFFSDDKYVMQYKMPDIEYHIRMTRENLVCFAMLVGSDYTDGIMNVGPVTALEILSEFPGDGLEPLVKFSDWHRDALRDKKLIGDKKRKKLLKYKLPEEFPSRAVYEGYLKPVADSTDEQFTWGTPELDELREYARRNFGWDQKKADEKLLPVMKKLNEKIQKTIDTFFFKTQANRNPEMFRSKRVNQALNKIAKRAALDKEVVNLSEEED